MSNGQDAVKTKLSDLEIILGATGIDNADAGDFTAYKDSLTAAKEEKSNIKAKAEWGLNLGGPESVKRYEAILDKTIEARKKREKISGRLDEKKKDTARIEELTGMLREKQDSWNEAESLYADQAKLFSPTTWGKLGQTFTNLYPEGHPLHKEGKMFQDMEAMRTEKFDLRNEWHTINRGTSKSAVLDRDLSAVEAVEASLTNLEDEWKTYYGGRIPKPADEAEPEWLTKAEAETALVEAKKPKPVSKEFSSRAHIIENDDGTFTPTYMSEKLDTVKTWDEAKAMIDPMIEEVNKTLSHKIMMNHHYPVTAISIAAEESKKDSADIHQKQVEDALLSLSQGQGNSSLPKTNKEKIADDSTSAAFVNSMYQEFEEDSIKMGDVKPDTSLPEGIVDTGDKNFEGYKIRLDKDMIEPYNKAKAALLDQGITLQLGDSYRHLSVQQEQYDAAKGTPKEGKVAKPENSLHPKGIAFDLAQTDEMKKPAVHKALIAAGFVRSRPDEWYHYSMSNKKALELGKITQEQFEMFSAYEDSAAQIVSSGT